MNHNENIQYNINNNYNLKTKPIKGVNGEIIEPSTYLDSNAPINKVGEDTKLTKEQLEEMKEKLATEIDKTTKAVSYDDLLEVAVYNSSDAVREQAREEIKRRILSGKMLYPSYEEIGKSKEDIAYIILDEIDRKRREYLQSVAQSKGNVR